MTEKLREALRPFAEISQFVEFTDFRDGEIVHRQIDRNGNRHELTKDHFRAAAAALAEPAAAPPDERNYLVWSNRHRAWWRPNSCGYVRSILGAGRYTKEEAVSISGDTRDHWTDPGELPEELAIPIDALPRAIRVLLEAAHQHAEGDAKRSQP